MTHLNETRISNFDDIFTGYFMNKLIDLPDQPQSDLDVHLTEITHVFHRTMMHLDQTEKYRFLKTFKFCSSLCGTGVILICISMEKNGRYS